MHLFSLPPPIPDTGACGRENERLVRRSNRQSCAEEDIMPSPPSTPCRTASVRTTNSNNTSISGGRTPTTPSSPSSFRAATPAFHTRSIPGTSLVERVPIPLSSSSIGPATPSDSEIIIVTIRLVNKFRSLSISSSDDLPTRPPARGFLRRLATRVNSDWDHASEREERWKVMRMPRGEYRKHFKKDAEGRYVGTEEEREWSEEDLEKEFGEFRGWALGSFVG